MILWNSIIRSYGNFYGTDDEEQHLVYFNQRERVTVRGSAWNGAAAKAGSAKGTNPGFLWLSFLRRSFFPPNSSLLFSPPRELGPGPRDWQNILNGEPSGACDWQRSPLAMYESGEKGNKVVTMRLTVDKKQFAARVAVEGTIEDSRWRWMLERIVAKNCRVNIYRFGKWKLFRKIVRGVCTG